MRPRKVTAPASYYTERGGVPRGVDRPGLDGIDGLAAGDPVTAEQMRALFGCGLHPLAEPGGSSSWRDLTPPIRIFRTSRGWGCRSRSSTTI